MGITNKLKKRLKKGSPSASAPESAGSKAEASEPAASEAVASVGNETPTETTGNDSMQELVYTEDWLQEQRLREKFYRDRQLEQQKREYQRLVEKEQRKQRSLEEGGQEQQGLVKWQGEHGRSQTSTPHQHASTSRMPLSSGATPSSYLPNAETHDSSGSAKRDLAPGSLQLYAGTISRTSPLVLSIAMLFSGCYGIYIIYSLLMEFRVTLMLFGICGSVVTIIRNFTVVKRTELITTNEAKIQLEKTRAERDIEKFKVKTRAQRKVLTKYAQSGRLALNGATEPEAIGTIEFTPLDQGYAQRIIAFQY